jgi:anaerobic selenocysteine-containing dehydrogenase
VFGSSKTVADPSIQGERNTNGIVVRTVYDVVVENIKSFTVEFAAEECGIPVEQIEELATLYATNKPVTKGIRSDTILVPHGYQGDEFIEGHPQTLTAMCLDPITSNNNLNDWLCQVEKI